MLNFSIISGPFNDSQKWAAFSFNPYSKNEYGIKLTAFGNSEYEAVSKCAREILDSFVN